MSAAASDADNRRWLRTPTPGRGFRPRWDLGFLLLVLALALAAPLIVRALGLPAPGVRDPGAVNLFGNPTGPGAGHPLGVDGQGRDVLSRVLYGVRSLVLVSLAGAGLATLASALAGALCGLHAWLGWLGDRLGAALGSFGGLLLGLALAASLNGVWRLLVPIALVQLRGFRSLRESGSVFAPALAGALGIDFGLTFLGVSPGASTPQLGAMVAQAGTGIVAGVPAWWALWFPGLAVMVVQLGAQSLARAWAPIAPAASIGPAASTRRRLLRRPVADGLLAAIAELALAVAFAALVFRSLAARDAGGRPALAWVGGDLRGSGSLLLGGLVIWAVVIWLGVTLITGSQRPRGLEAQAPPKRHGVQASSKTHRVQALVGRLGVRGLVRLGAAVLVAAPAGWLAFGAVRLFSESVGTLPVLPGPGSYVGLSSGIGAWARPLIIPWLLLGLLPGARTLLWLNRAAAGVAASDQQRVARAAGVPEATLARQRRRALWAPQLAQVAASLPGFAGTALIIEVVNRIPGVGAMILHAHQRGEPATVSDLVLLVGAGLIVVSGVLGVLEILTDPRAARR